MANIALNLNQNGGLEKVVDIQVSKSEMTLVDGYFVKEIYTPPVGEISFIKDCIIKSSEAIQVASAYLYREINSYENAYNNGTLILSTVYTFINMTQGSQKIVNNPTFLKIYDDGTTGNFVITVKLKLLCLEE